MCHGLKWFIHLRAQWPRVGDEHPTYAPAGTWQTLPLPLLRELYCSKRHSRTPRNPGNERVHSRIPRNEERSPGMNSLQQQYRNSKYYY